MAGPWADTDAPAARISRVHALTMTWASLPGAAALGPGLAHGRSVVVAPRAEVDVAMERYSSGDDTAFAAVYDALAPRLYGYLLRQTREASRAEDILQKE